MPHYTLLPHVIINGAGFALHKEPAVGFAPTGSSYRVDYAVGTLEKANFTLADFRRERKKASLNRHVYFRRPIPYLVHSAEVVPSTGVSNPLSSGAGYYCDFAYTNSTIQLTYNKAYQRFLERCRQQVAGGEFLGELGKTYASLEKPLNFLRGLVSAVQKSKRDPRQLLGVLLSPESPLSSPRFTKGSRNKLTGRQRWRDRERAKRRSDFLRRTRNKGMIISDTEASLANAWLEYTYGLGPALESVYDACVIIAESVPPYGMVRASASGSFSLNSKSGKWTNEGYVKVRFRLQADVQVTNSLAYTLEQFGVINPAKFAWDLLPFSFLIDWVVNVGEMLGALSDFAGITLSDPFVGEKRTGSSSHKYDEGPPWGVTQSYIVESKSFRRSLGIPGPSYVLKLTALESVRRAMNAVALVTSIGHSALHNQPSRGFIR